MKRVLVTGGAGFIGSHLCQHLMATGAYVVCLDNFFTGTNEFAFGHEVIRHDVCDPFHFEVDEVYHLACPASPVHYSRNPVRTIKTCVQGTLNALDCARDVGAKIFLASTSEVYGDPAVHPQTEGYWGNVNPIGPRSCYDEGKRCAEALAVSYSRQFAVEVRIARIFNCYGPRMLKNDGRVVSNFVYQALRDQSLSIWGGTQTRSFMYVDDLVDGILRLMLSEEHEPVNLGNPEEVTIDELADMVIQIVGKGHKMAMSFMQDEPMRRKPDITKAERLNWKPKIKLSDGLELTVADFRRRFS